jgi:hypothetical protein
MATLNCGSNVSCITVGNVDGVRVSGVMFQADWGNPESLLQWGVRDQGANKNESYAGNSQNPGVMHDIFTRVGGNNNVTLYNATAQYMTLVNSGNVIIDNTWLWRADHSVDGLVMDGENAVEAGLVVYGDNVIAYGLAVEHTLGNMM